MFTIEKGIPIPAAQPRGAAVKYPFAQMEIGDSFFVPSVVKGDETADKAAERLKSSLSSHKRRAQKQTGFVLTVRVVDGGVRVWRNA